MPITIGAKPESSFDRPIGLLKDCHRRFEKYLLVFEHLAKVAAGGTLSAEEAASLTRAIDYFEIAAVRHVADEEESLFPRMRAHPEGEAALDEIEALEQDHCRAHVLHCEANLLGRRWIAAGRLTTGEQARFADAATALAQLYREHIAREDGELFPLAERLLSEDDLTGMGREMADRRGLFATA